MSFLPRPRKRARPDFSLAIINIVFLLMLFYLATGSLIKPAELAADAPVTRDLPLELLPRPLLLVEAEGALFIDGVPVAKEALADAARNAAAEAGALNVLADRSLSARDLFDIIAQVEAGGVPLRIVTLRGVGFAEGNAP